MLQRWRANFPILSLTLIWIVLPVLAIGLAAFSVLEKSLPLPGEVIRVKGLQHEASIRRNAPGVVQIRAQSDLSVFYALGFAHAQDRLWQLEFNKRLGQGRLSEVLGKKTLATDRFMRTLGLAEAAETALQHLSAEARAVLAAYAEGVNAWIAQARVLPVEFYLHHTEPQAWNPSDSLLQIKLMALNLSANFRDELVDQVLLKHLGEQKFSELRLYQPNRSADVLNRDGDNANNATNDLARIYNGLAFALGRQADGIGSNAWVVSGRHTQSGKPLLAADPHLNSQLPATFYLAELKGDKLDVRGATIPGVPVVIFGNNQQIAWGATNLAADVQDLYVERVNPRDDSVYLGHDGWQPFELRRQSLAIAREFPALLRRKIEPLTWTVRKSRHGPIISDLMASGGQVVALRWTALDAADTSYEAFLKLNYARDWEAFNRALALHVAPAMSFVYADRDNNIGMAAAGKIPLRDHGGGRFPVAGWSGQAQWQRFLTPQELPRVFNPPRGYIVSANNQWYAAEYPYLISNNWQPDYRADRIAQLLEEGIAARRAFDVQAFAEMQSDKLNRQAGELMDFIAQLDADSGRQRKMLDYLLNWDTAMAPDSVAAAIYHSWLDEFSRLIVADELKADLTFPERAPLLEGESERLRPLFVAQVAGGEKQHWCDDSATAQREDCHGLALRALDETFKKYKLLHGRDMDDWQWRALQEVNFPHASAQNHQLADKLFSRRHGAGGGPYTVDVAGSRFVYGEGYRKTLGASYRQIIDLGAAETASFSIDVGQSGNIVSRHYDDFMTSHALNTPVPMHFSDAGDMPVLLIPEPDTQAAASRQGGAF